MTAQRWHSTMQSFRDMSLRHRCCCTLWQELWQRSGEAGLVSSILQCSPSEPCAVSMRLVPWLLQRAPSQRGPLVTAAALWPAVLLQCWGVGLGTGRAAWQGSTGCAASWAPAPRHPPRAQDPQAGAQFELQWVIVPERPQCLHTVHCFTAHFPLSYSLHCVLSTVFSLWEAAAWFPLAVWV